MDTSQRYLQLRHAVAELSIGNHPERTLSTPEWTVVLYDELRRLAARYLEHERPDHTLQPTALVNEAYLRLSKLEHIQWSNKLHFYMAASGTIRRVLVDHARSHQSLKRRSFQIECSLESGEPSGAPPNLDYLELDEAMRKLAQMDDKMCQVVELRFFGGLTIDQTAETLNLSLTTVKDKWMFARIWLRRELEAHDP